MSDYTNMEQDESSGFPTKAWLGIMLFCVVSLGVLGSLSGDKEVYFYVKLGILVMFLAPVRDMIIAAGKVNDFWKEYDERKRKAAEEMELKEMKLKAMAQQAAAE